MARKNCECGCGQETTIYRGVHRRFISGHYGRGKPLSDDIKQNLSDSHKGRKLSDYTKRKIGESNKGKNLGRKHTEDTKRKIGEAHSGEKSHLWQGGVSFEPYCSKFNNVFKESVREKFGRVCFLCGEPEKGRKLDVHHVNYDKSCLCSDIKCEFVPLCRSCHMKTNCDRDYYERLILEKLATLLY